MILEIIGEIIKTVMLRRNQSRERGALIMARFRFSFISLLSFHGAAFAAWDGAAGAGFEDSMIRHVDSPYEETMATRLTFTESAASFPVRMLLLLCFSPSCLEADVHVTCVIIGSAVHRSLARRGDRRYRSGRARVRRRLHPSRRKNLIGFGGGVGALVGRHRRIGPRSGAVPESPVRRAARGRVRGRPPSGIFVPPSRGPGSQRRRLSPRLRPYRGRMRRRSDPEPPLRVVVFVVVFVVGGGADDGGGGGGNAAGRHHQLCGRRL